MSQPRIIESVLIEAQTPTIKGDVYTLECLQNLAMNNPRMFMRDINRFNLVNARSEKRNIWVRLSEEFVKLAHEARVQRIERGWANRRWRTTDEYRAEDEYDVST